MADSFIQTELHELRKEYQKELPGSELIACHPVSVRVKMTKTEYRQFDVCLQFPEGYPNTSIVVELKSKTIPEKLRDGLTKVCDTETKKLCGKPQLLPVLRLLKQFLDDNPFAICSEELSFIKKELITEKDQIKVKQKSGSISMTIYQDNYYFSFKMIVPEEYPAKQVCIQKVDDNFPKLFSTVFFNQAIEMARQCVEPPLKKKPKDAPFEPKPSLKLIAKFLVEDCIRRYPRDPCQICKDNAFPPDPKSVVTVPSNDRYIERVYCCHLFHHGCLDTFMKTPPFTGGKKCPGCKQRIYHDKWNITPRLAEERWAHQEAKRRELAEVVDFLE
ncbi:uncharacterized protein LOC100372397 [Saccoglossus kowalevskii]|uniref:Uncharacterized protein LOC100372397 n=1 Tax=Saccoglossus kowalevskii TaxID=10224 RepID=A0ABM0MU65_SACKO|nr:PREDICTED: uncharacterized protein LOC100372397 [Saccoglossus kowalevskii]